MSVLFIVEFVIIGVFYPGSFFWLFLERREGVAKRRYPSQHLATVAQEHVPEAVLLKKRSRADLTPRPTNSFGRQCNIM